MSLYGNNPARMCLKAILDFAIEEAPCRGYIPNLRGLSPSGLGKDVPIIFEHYYCREGLLRCVFDLLGDPSLKMMGAAIREGHIRHHSLYINPIIIKLASGGFLSLPQQVDLLVL